MEPVVDRSTVRMLVVVLALLALVGMGGTLYLLASDSDSSSVAVFVGLAGVPIGCLSTLATNRSTPVPPAPVTAPVVGPTARAGQGELTLESQWSTEGAVTATTQSPSATVLLI